MKNPHQIAESQPFRLFGLRYNDLNSSDRKHKDTGQKSICKHTKVKGEANTKKSQFGSAVDFAQQFQECLS